MGRNKPEGQVLLRIRLGLVLGVVLVFSITPLGAGLFSRLLTDSGFNAQAENLDAAFLRVHVLDVGKADAVLLESQGCAALLDAGTSEDGETVADYLHRQGIEKLDYAIVSQPASCGGSIGRNRARRRQICKSFLQKEASRSDCWPRAKAFPWAVPALQCLAL